MQCGGWCHTGALGVWMMGAGCVPSEHAGQNPPPPLPLNLTLHSTELCQECSAGSGVIGGGSGGGRAAEKEKSWIL